MLKGLKITLFVFAFTMAMWLGCGGCVKTTRVIMDKEGKIVEETTSWEPPVVVYGEPSYYRRPYYRSVVVGREYPRYLHSRPIFYSRSHVYPRIARSYWRPVRRAAIYPIQRHRRYR